MPSIYRLDYEGSREIELSDGRADLHRWFDKWKLDRAASFADEHETLTIEERKFQAARRRAVRYVGEIVDVNGPIIRPSRRVLFETNAPAPPTFFRPGKPRPEPKPPRARDSGTLTVDTIYEAMEEMGMSGERRHQMVMAAHSPWDLMHAIRTERYLQEERRVALQMHTMNWLMPVLAGDGVYSDLDTGSGGVTVLAPVPPPKRYRRNA